MYNMLIQFLERLEFVAYKFIRQNRFPSGVWTKEGKWQLTVTCTVWSYTVLATEKFIETAPKTTALSNWWRYESSVTMTDRVGSDRTQQRFLQDLRACACTAARAEGDKPRASAGLVSLRNDAQALVGARATNVFKSWKMFLTSSSSALFPSL